MVINRITYHITIDKDEIENVMRFALDNNLFFQITLNGGATIELYTAEDTIDTVFSTNPDIYREWYLEYNDTEIVLAITNEI